MISPAGFRRISVFLPFLAVALTNADTIELNSQQQITGVVTNYANYSFEVRSTDGKTATYPAPNVHRILFDPSGTVAKFTTRANGMQEGTASSFENGAFNVTTNTGMRQFPLISVERVAFVAARGQDVEVIDHGQQIDIAKYLAIGNVTVIEFYADWCGPCKQVSPVLEQMARNDPEIAVRKIDIVNWGTPVAKQYNIHLIPQVNVYNRSGQLVGSVAGVNLDQVKRYIAQVKSGG
jgi:thiol-disulfide isomerase/thioredoxin